MMVGKVADLSYEDGWGRGAPPCLFNSLCRRNLLPGLRDRGGGSTCFVISLYLPVLGKPSHYQTFK